MKMPDSTLTSKGQTTVPQEIREAVGLQTGTKLIWNLAPGGVLIVRAKTQSIKSLEGVIKVPKGKTISIQDMNPWK
jgi:AbrB family looped-hinge helix DNA binding protein